MILDVSYLQANDPVIISTSTIILAFATVALVFITGYYALQTRNTVRSVMASAELSIRPHIKGSIIPMGPVSISLRISNIGTGPANRINLKYWIDSIEDSSRTWTKPLLMANESEEFFIAVDQNNTQHSMDYFKNNQTVLNIEGECENILGKSYPIQDSINVTEYVAQFQQTNVRYQEEPLRDIARTLNEIKQRLDRINR